MEAARIEGGAGKMEVECAALEEWVRGLARWRKGRMYMDPWPDGIFLYEQKGRMYTHP